MSKKQISQDASGNRIGVAWRTKVEAVGDSKDRGQPYVALEYLTDEGKYNGGYNVGTYQKVGKQVQFSKRGGSWSAFEELDGQTMSKEELGRKLLEIAAKESRWTYQFPKAA